MASVYQSERSAVPKMSAAIAAEPTTKASRVQRPREDEQPDNGLDENEDKGERAHQQRGQQRIAEELDHTVGKGIELRQAHEAVHENAESQRKAEDEVSKLSVGRWLGCGDVRGSMSFRCKCGLEGIFSGEKG